MATQTTGRLLNLPYLGMETMVGSMLSPSTCVTQSSLFRNGNVQSRVTSNVLPSLNLPYLGMETAFP